MASESNRLVGQACPRCAAALRFPIVCADCGWLKDSLDPVDFFELLGLPRKYAVVENELSQAYRALARLIHPDRFAGQSDENIARATAWSSEVNRAYEALRDPGRRADYLLDQNGGPSAAEDREVPASLLAEVMEWREAMSAFSPDDTSDERNRLRSDVALRREDLLSRIEKSAAGLKSASAVDRTELRRMLNSLRYLDNLVGDLAANPLSSSTSISHVR